MKSALNLRSNLMLWDREPHHQHLPGDYVGQIYPDYIDKRAMDRYLTERQILELKQYLVCLKCGRPCAGTCER